MKNAMKKLMSVLLVAVLLISAVPFAASAGGVGLTVTVNGGATKTTTGSLNETVYVSNCLDFVGVTADKVASVWVQKVGDAEATQLALDGNFSLSSAAQVTIYMSETYTLTVNYNDGRVENCTIVNGKKIGTSVLPTAPTSKGRQFTGWTLSDGTAIDANWEAYSGLNGATVYANWNIVGCTECGQTDGHNSSCSKYVASNNGSSNNSSSNNNSTTTTTATYVDVILVTNKTSGFVDGEFHRCELVNGHITQDDRDKIANKISGKNIVAWKRGDGVGDPVSTLLDFNFTGLTAPINILPVVGTTNNSGSNNSNTNNSGISTKDNTNQVWLHVYINGNAGTIDKSINLTNTYLMDDKSTNVDEIKNYLLTNYYKSSNTNKNVELDGLYVTNGTFPQNYYTDNNVSFLNNIDQELAKGYVHISVMLKNVTAKTTTTTTADSSNPKTGDSIYTAMTVMGISAATLAAVMYVYTKKRQAI